MKSNKDIQIEHSDLQILKEILRKYPYKFYVYGSRAKGNASRYSDIDIFCKKEIIDSDLVSLLEDLEESNITIKVDVLDLRRCSKEFFIAIENDLISL